MGEAEWLDGRHHSQSMVWVFRGTKVTRTKAGKRKLRLVACACCRLSWGLLRDPLLQRSVEVAERFADGEADKGELETAYEAARELWMAMPSSASVGGREEIAAGLAAKSAQPNAFSAAFDMTAYPVPLTGGYGAWEQE